MKRKQFKIRLGLVLATMVAALSLTASAQAIPVYDTGSGPSASSQAVATSGGFDWGYAGIGAGVALAALGALGTVRFTRSRSRLAGQH